MTKAKVTTKRKYKRTGKYSKVKAPAFDKENLKVGQIIGYVMHDYGPTELQGAIQKVIKINTDKGTETQYELANGKLIRMNHLKKVFANEFVFEA